MPPVSIELGLRRKLRDPSRKDRDRVAVAAEVRRPAACPDERVRVIRLLLESRPRLREAGFPVALRFRVERRREERLAEKGPGLGARRQLVLRTRRRLPPRRRARGEKRDREENKTAVRD